MLLGKLSIWLAFVSHSNLDSGYYSSRSDPEVAGPDTSMATNGMIIFDHKTKEIVNITDSSDRSGYTHGALHQIIPGNGGDDDGMLLNLMALQGPLETNFTENDKDGPMEPVSRYIWLYFF